MSSCAYATPVSHNWVVSGPQANLFSSLAGTSAHRAPVLCKLTLKLKSSSVQSCAHKSSYSLFQNSIMW